MYIKEFIAYLLKIYPAIFGHLIFYTYRVYTHKKVFNIRNLLIQIGLTIGIGTILMKILTSFNISEDLCYVLMFIAGGFCMDIYKLLEEKIPGLIGDYMDKKLKKF